MINLQENYKQVCKSGQVRNTVRDSPCDVIISKVFTFKELKMLQNYNMINKTH